jgi:hypothetical protein
MSNLSTLEHIDLDALVGRSVDEAREIVTGAGGTLRTLAPDQPMTLDYRADRVTVIVDNERVERSLGIG